MKRLLSSLFVVLTPLSVFAFADTENSEFKSYIDNMVSEGLVSGYSDGKFRPNNSVSFFESLKIATNTTSGKQHIYNQNEQDFYKNIYNQQFSQNEKVFAHNDKISRDFAMYIILKNLGINLENTKIANTFPDVNENSLFSNYINFAKNNGIIGGYANGNFGPNNPVTRGEFAKMSWRAIRENRSTLLQNAQSLTNNTAVQAQIMQNKNTATVVSVSDGDTLKVRNTEGNIETIRILGLDAPESFTTRFGYKECYGDEASNFLNNYLPTGAVIDIIYSGGDKYNRDLAEVFYQWESIATTMIKNGYGWVYRDGTEPGNYQELIRIENSLKWSNIGLWSVNTCNGERRPISTNTASQTPVTSVISTTTTNISPVTQTTTTSSSYRFIGGFAPISGSCNDHIKWNINTKNEKIYHTTSSTSYNKTNPEWCFYTTTEAENNGFRAPRG